MLEIMMALTTAAIAAGVIANRIIRRHKAKQAERKRLQEWFNPRLKEAYYCRALLKNATKVKSMPRSYGKPMKFRHPEKIINSNSKF